MSVISPCHLRHELLRLSYVVYFETTWAALRGCPEVCDGGVGDGGVEGGGQLGTKWSGLARNLRITRARTGSSLLVPSAGVPETIEPVS
jgi:hypothetical protein